MFYLEEEILFYYSPGVYEIEYEHSDSSTRYNELFYSDEYFTEKEFITHFQKKISNLDMNTDRIDIKGERSKAYKERPKTNKRSF